MAHNQSVTLNEAVMHNEAADSSRTMLISAAVQILEQVGYNRLRTADVAKQSGLSEGSLFHYFPTKYSLVAAATERALEDVLARSAAAFAQLGPVDDVRKVLELLWQLLSDKRITWTHELFGAVAGDPSLREAVWPVIHRTNFAFDELANSVVKATGRVPDDRCAGVADFAIFSMQGLAGRNMARGDSGRHLELIEFTALLFDVAYPARNPVSS